MLYTAKPTPRVAGTAPLTAAMSAWKSSFDLLPPRRGARNGAVEGAKARVGVKRARWPPVILRGRGLAVKARAQGGESEASRA